MNCRLIYVLLEVLCMGLTLAGLKSKYAMQLLHSLKIGLYFL